MIYSCIYYYSQTVTLFNFFNLLPTAIMPCPVAVLHKQRTIRTQYGVSVPDIETSKKHKINMNLMNTLQFGIKF
jgi:hypothetical protein